MKNVLLIAFCFLTFGTMFAQEEELSKEEKERREKNIEAGNPFAEFGYKAKVATLSKGKYLEVHDLDSIVKIGSSLWHVRKHKIVGNAEQDTTDMYRQPLFETAGRWLSPDPLAEEFPEWNPYHYVHNNPINMIDPTGLAAEDWYATSNGDIKYGKNIKSQADLDKEGIEGEYIAESFVGITESQSVYKFNEDGTTNVSNQDAIGEGITVIPIEVFTGEMTLNTTPSKGKQFALEAGAAVVVSQSDSPAPGPADVIALGILYNAVKNLIIPQQEEGYYNLEFAKSKKGKTSSRQEDVQHGNQGTGKLSGSKKTKHQKRRPGDRGEKKRQKPGWKQH